jgi:LemA protein
MVTTIVFGLMTLAAIAAVCAAAYGVVLFNGLVQVKHNVDQAWSNIDVLLKERSDELGKLIDAVGAYMKYERALLDRLTALRSTIQRGGAGQDRLDAERELSAGLGRLLAVAENYPDLKANASFLDLQHRISALEEQIADRREFYNDAVNINNVRREQFPDLFLVGIAGLQPRPLFEAAPVERADVDVNARLRQVVNE